MAGIPSTVITSPQHRAPARTTTRRNVENVVLGNLHFVPEFPSFYPEELIGGRKASWLYVCQWCYNYTHELLKHAAHCKVCPCKDESPPGELIYEEDGYAIHQVDGEENKLFAQNLSLFAKLFLDTKSVFFDVSSFLYYLLILQPPKSGTTLTNGTSSAAAYGQVVGFFSKEKMSWDNNNLACILIFPPWQRRNLGQILIAASYILGRHEGRFGGPEKPLSAPGRKAYLAYWCGEAAREILGAPGKKTVSVRNISESCWILGEDVVAALREMGITESRKTAGGNLVVNKSRVRAWVEKHRVSLTPIVDADAFLLDEASLDGSAVGGASEGSE
ncbi:SAS complex subunit [Oleoguttula sp. CCFEE 5521]